MRRRSVSALLAFVLSTGLLTLSGPSAHAATTWSKNNDIGLDVALNAVFIPPGQPEADEDDPPTVVVAVGGEGTVLKSTDGGETWTTTHVPAAPGRASPPALGDVHFPATDTGYAVGAYGNNSGGVVYRSSDGGETWELVGGENLDIAYQGVWFTDADTGHVVGKSGQGAQRRAKILRTDDGGATWGATFAHGQLSELRSVSFFNADVGVAVGDGPALAPANFSGFIVRTQDGGQTWQQHTIAGEGRAVPGILRSVWAVPSADPTTGVAYAVGDATGTGQAGGQIWKTEDGGVTWLPQVSGSPANLRDVAFADAEQGFAVGGTFVGGQALPLILATEDGHSWTPDPILTVPNFQLNGVAAGTDGFALAVGTGGAVVRRDEGADPGEVVEEVANPHPPRVPPPSPDRRCPTWDPAKPPQEKGIVEDGILKRGGTQSEVAIDESAGILYEFEGLGPTSSLPSAPSRARVWARDLATLCLLSDSILLEDGTDDHTAYGPVSAPEVDETQNRLFVAYQRGPTELYERGDPTDPDDKFSRSTGWGVAAIGPDPQQGPGESPRIVQLAQAALPPGLPPFVPNASTPGLALYPQQGDAAPLSRAKLYLVIDYSNLVSSGNFQPGTALVFLVQADVDRLMGGALNPFDWVFPVPACGRTPTGGGGMRRGAVVRAGRTVGVACAQGRFVAEGGGSVGGVARIDLDDQAFPAGSRFFPQDGVLQNQPSIADPVSGRLFLGAKTSKGAGLAGFDVARGVWFGFIPDSRKIELLAIDRATGRLYVGVINRVIVTDARADDLPQGKSFELPRAFPPQSDAAPVDSKRRRLFPAGNNSDELRPLSDASVTDDPSEPFDPDDLTNDVDEIEGLTGATFSGGTQGYGLRGRWVNGARGTSGGFATACGHAIFFPPYCPHLGTRELVLAHVPEAKVADSEASAEAVGAEYDGAGTNDGSDRDLATLTFEEPDELLITGGTSSDSEEPTPREQLANGYREFKDQVVGDDTPFHDPYEQAQEHRRANTVPNRWPYRRVHCSDAGGNAQQDVTSEDGAVFTIPTSDDETQDVPARFSSSFVSCNRQTKQVAAEAVFGTTQELPSSGSPPLVTVGSARTTSVSYHDPAAGLVSRVKAEVTGLRLAHPERGEVSIGVLGAVAETRATGRARNGDRFGAGGSFERHMEDVWVKPAGEEEPTRVCGDNCDPAQVIRILNAVLGTRMHFDLPEPDPERIGGTPGGYEAVVTRDPAEMTSDKVTNEEAVDRLEVPGLRVTLYADETTGFSRYILQVAGVSADSKYGIFCLYGKDDEGECNPEPSSPPPPPASEPQEPTVDAPAHAVPVVHTNDPVTQAVRETIQQTANREQPPQTAVTPPSLGNRILRRVIEGFKFLFNSLVDVLRSAGMWMLLAAPLILYVRRRWLPAPRTAGRS